MRNNKLTFEILMSCMHQKNFSLIDESNIHSNVLMVNQCDEDAIYVENKESSYRKMICTTQRGLSKSRNMALEHATGDIILFADDDEWFEDSVEDIVLGAFDTINADIIVFDIYDYEKGLKRTIHKLNLLETLKISSCQIACKRESIGKKGVKFDVNLGAGTPNGAGEENKFLWDAHKAGLTILYYPKYIVRLTDSKSTWFEGFTRNYFYKRGKVTGYFMGKGLASAYALYFAVTKYRLYKKECSFVETIISLMKGIYSEKNSSNI